MFVESIPLCRGGCIYADRAWLTPYSSHGFQVFDYATTQDPTASRSFALFLLLLLLLCGSLL
jgi:hypothetical protein